MMKILGRALLLLTFFSLFVCQLPAQGEVSFDLITEKTQLQIGEKFDVRVRADILPGWHLYSMEVPPGGPVPTSISVEEDQNFAADGNPRQPEPIPWFDQNFNMQTNYFEGSVVFDVPVRVKPTASTGEASIGLKIRFMLCNESSCLPPQTQKISASFEISPAAEGSSEVIQLTEPAVAESGPPEEGSGALPLGTLAYLWFAMGMGALALLTPCVFPMIPITVSYFTKKESRSRKRTIFEAGLYSVGIVATFTILGFALTFLFGAGGINRLAASPLVNGLIALVFLAFALSLFGAIEFRIPSTWLTAVDKKSAKTGGVLGILLMSLAFSLTSFTCTVPFVGTVMVAALQGDFAWALLGVTAFATVFSLPFFLLALFPSWLQSLPKSGNWMNSVKVVMGFLELAAALKFISNVDLVYQWELLTRPVFITCWLAIGIVTVAYLLGKFRFAHETSAEAIGALRVFFAIFFLAVSIYLFRGLLGFPLGELDAFLPPRDYGATATSSLFGSSSTEEEKWYSNYDTALKEAKSQNRNVFIDFTGYTCTNCRWMEANVFTIPKVQELFEHYVLVRLYTDGPEPQHEANLQFEQERFGTIALPFYALVDTNGETISTFPGLTRNSAEFIAFLQSGIRNE